MVMATTTSDKSSAKRRHAHGASKASGDWVSPKWTAVEFIADAGLSVQENKSRAATAFHTAVAAADYTGGKIYDHVTLIPAKLGGADVTSARGSTSSSA